MTELQMCENRNFVVPVNMLIPFLSHLYFAIIKELVIICMNKF